MNAPIRISLILLFLTLGSLAPVRAQLLDVSVAIGGWAPDCTPRVSYHHPFEAPGCNTFGEVYRWREDGEAVVEVELNAWEPECAEASFEATVAEYEYRYGPPTEIGYGREHCEIERSATWEMHDRFLEVRLELGREEAILEVVAGED